MTNGGAGFNDRPLCRCHGVVMDRDGARPNGSRRFSCAVKRRARQAAAYHANAAAANYVRTRHALRARIALKRARLEELEEHGTAQD